MRPPVAPLAPSIALFATRPLRVAYNATMAGRAPRSRVSRRSGRVTQMTNDDTIDIAAGLPIDPLDDSPDAQVWRLLCAQTLGEVDPSLAGIRADDIATEMGHDDAYRGLDAVAAAYLWLARHRGTSQLLVGR